MVLPGKFLIELSPIGVIRSPFKEKFGLPRQGGLCPHLWGEIHLHAPYRDPSWWDDLEGISHLWVLSFFHEAHKREAPRPKVRPPRLGGNQKISVFATRSPQRPNPLGLTLVEFGGLVCDQHSSILKIKNHDLLDGTPVLDIKPYLCDGDRPSTPYLSGWIGQQEHPRFQVEWALAKEQLPSPELIACIEEVVAQDIRPRYQAGDKPFHFSLDQWDVSVRQKDSKTFEIIGIAPLKKTQ